MSTEEPTTLRDPRPGDFVPPDRNPRSPRKEAAAEEKVDAAAAEPQTQIPASDVEQQAAERAQLYEDMAKGLSPVEDYQAYLKEMGISEEKAQQIIDDLFTKSFYVEKVSLTKRVSAMLRTREHADTLRLQTALEVQRPVYTYAMEEVTTRYNMAASLQSFGDTTFTFPDVGADKEEIERLFDVRLAYVERMPDPAFYKLSGLLAKFDRNIAAVMREGVAENF